MNARCWRALLGVASIVVTVATLGDATLAALDTSPAVNIRRISSLYDAVWPGDFNGDGIVDLVGSGAPGEWEPGQIRIALGKGDGTFQPPITSAFAGRVLGVGDFNDDRKLDVLIDQHAAPFILPGNGDGTLGGAQRVGSGADLIDSAVVADFDRDGALDVALSSGEEEYWPEVRIFRGRGDFTFDPPVTLVGGWGRLTSADFNGDARSDIALASVTGLTIYQNKGSFVFIATDIVLETGPTDVTAADVNGDGKLDLVASSLVRDPTQVRSPATAGYVYVLLGRGDGTFKAPQRYDVAPGAARVVVGDFTRDGILDIATSNWSSLYVNDCTAGWKTWDTVSILPGRGVGTFAAASSFSLGNQLYPEDSRFRNTATSLRAADMNRDGVMDLVASHGAILLTMPPDANWPPKVSAGADQASPIGQIVLRAAASDVDQDMLTYAWSDSAGTTIPPVPIPCVSVSPGVHVFTVAVSDGHGHQASDSVTYTIGTTTPPVVTVTAPVAGEVVRTDSPYTIKWTASSPTTLTRFDVQSSETGGQYWREIYACTDLPGTARECLWPTTYESPGERIVRVTARDSFNQIGVGDSGVFTVVDHEYIYKWWSDEQDIGAVAKPGSGRFDDQAGVSTISGSGADIWGTADEFHYAYSTWLPGHGDTFEITTRVDWIQAVNAWTKAGLMIRESLAPGSRHVSLFATPGKGLAFQRRLTTNGTSVNTSGPLITAPVWLKLTRTTTTIQAFYRKNTTDFWTPIGSADTAGWTNELHFGLAVTSHADGTLATATFSRRAQQPWSPYSGFPEYRPFLDAQPLPSWSGLRIGTAAGSATWNGAVITINGDGTDIWGTADGFYFLHVPITGDWRITARVRSLQNTNAWAKAGVMIRETLTPGSKHVMAVVTPGKGLAMQYRAATGGISANVALAAGSVPEWLLLQRAGDLFTAWTSNDYVTWTKLGTVTVPMSGEVYFGLPVTSHTTSMTTRAIFEDVSMKAYYP